MKKNIYLFPLVGKKLIVCLTLLLVFTSPQLFSQNTIQLPDCNDCGGAPSGSSSGVGSEYGIFPYKVVDIASVNRSGTHVLVTENGKVFAWGAVHNNSISFDPEDYTVSYGGYSYSYGGPPVVNDPLISPTRFDLPAGVKAVRCAVSTHEVWVISDQGLLYGMGSPTAPNLFGGSPHTNTEFSPIALPPGASSIVDITTSRIGYARTIVIDDLGRAWILGATNVNPVTQANSWEQFSPPASGVTYSKAWIVSLTSDATDIKTFFLEASDGNYYAFGNNVSWSFGSLEYINDVTNLNATSSFFQGNYTHLSPSDTPAKVEFPVGTVIKKFTGFYPWHISALATDGTIYVWGGWPENLDLPLVTSGIPAQGTTVKTPEPVHPPTSNSIIPSSPTHFINMDETGRILITNDGGVYVNPNYHPNNITVRLSQFDGSQHYQRSFGIHSNYTKLTYNMGLTEDGRVFYISESLISSPLSHLYLTNDRSGFLLDPRWDYYNPRPTE